MWSSLKNRNILMTAILLEMTMIAPMCDRVKLATGIDWLGGQAQPRYSPRACLETGKLFFELSPLK